jgi:hypothetical protein
VPIGECPTGPKTGTEDRDRRPGPKTGTGTGTGTGTSGGVGDGLPLGVSGETLPTLPGISAAPGGAGNPAGLFPTVTPSPGTSSPGIGFPPARKQAGRRTQADTASSVVPLDPKLIGGQLLGLAVLAGAVVITIVRLSVRRARPRDGSENENQRPGS